ncbi:MAG: hypothetical protein JW715_16900 [Sedimentisphaerales bacterium]|nr:hypothetical protein [Sedimentisphaerales bacterium]
MKINEFITKSLKGIADGVANAQEEANAIVNPGRIDEVDQKVNDHDGKFLIANKTMGRLAQVVDFDLAVTVSEESTREGGVGLMVVGMDLGIKGKRNISTSSVSRIKFSIPVVFRLDEGH